MLLNQHPRSRQQLLLLWQHPRPQQLQPLLLQTPLHTKQQQRWQAGYIEAQQHGCSIGAWAVEWRLE
jgi:hypothetical protein